MKTNTVMSLLIITALIAGCRSEKLSEATVRLDDGIVQGTLEDGIAVFRGIPFAAPPVGELRWKAPQPVEPWQGIMKADNYAPVPVQVRTQWMGDEIGRASCRERVYHPV